RNIWDWQKIVDARDFDIALDFSGDFYDDPTFQLTKYVSHDLSPVNCSGSTDRFLDAMFVAQAMTTDPRQRAKMVRDFERHALNEAYTVPLLWWNRIVAHSSKLMGWNITPSLAISSARILPMFGLPGTRRPCRPMIMCLVYARASAPEIRSDSIGRQYHGSAAPQRRLSRQPISHSG